MLDVNRVIYAAARMTIKYGNQDTIQLLKMIKYTLLIMHPHTFVCNKKNEYFMLFDIICIFEPKQTEVQVGPIIRRSVMYLLITAVGNMAAVPVNCHVVGAELIRAIIRP